MLNSNSLLKVNLFVLILASFYSWLVPTRDGWDALTDALLRFSIIGLFCLIALILSVYNLKSGLGNKNFNKIVLGLMLLPSLGFLVFMVMLILKLA